MPKWLKIEETGHGEWCVTDLRRNYRICAFNESGHGGPHVHHPIDRKEPVGALAVDGVGHAERVARRFAESAERYDSFNLERLREALS